MLWSLVLILQWKTMLKENNSSREYLDKNRGFVTASKLKYFLTYGPEAYYYKFVKEIILDEEEKDYYIVWTAFDDLLSYWEDAWWEKYYIDEGLLKDDLIKKCEEKWFRTDWKVEDLKKRLYGDKIKLTPLQGESVLWMYKEAKRQPLVDLWNPLYMTQKDIECEFEGLKLKGTLDRLNLDEKMIRDRKTSGQFQNFEYNIETTFDYILSMSFYYVLVKVNFGVNCDVILDVFGKSKPYPYMWYKLDKVRLLSSLENKIIPWLRALKECYEKDEWKSVYPIDYVTQNRYGDVISYTKGEPIARTKLMECEYYGMLEGWLAEKFITPSF